MKIVTIPHPSLRKKAEPITEVDAALIKLVSDLETTLDEHRDPPGVGLAGPQLDKLVRIFATKFPAGDKVGKPGNRPPGQVRHFINPQIIKACKRKKVLGVKADEPDLEGCLSMPGLYGPVPRHRWVELEFQTLEDGELVEQKERFEGFKARVVQHELDHLDGILFTDYALENNLSVYRENESGQGLVEIEPELVEII